MYRRIVSLILMPFVLLTQSVTFGHSHAGNEPAGHNLHAHIHFNTPSAEGQHGHVHSHGGHCHAHENHSQQNRDRQTSDQLESPFHHDSSAVYLNSSDLTTGPRSNIRIDMIVQFQWNETGTDLFSETLPASGPDWLVQDCAPPDPDSPLFLRHHAILI